MVSRVEPERELIRRVLPFGPAAVVIALLAGLVAGGWPGGLSAAIGVGVVVANFVAHGWSLSRAARLSLAVLSAVALGGFVIRLAAIVGILFALDQFPFFSPLAFLLAVVPATALLLAFEMQQLRGRMQAELWDFAPPGSVKR
jgi:hypothetical protein